MDSTYSGNYGRIKSHETEFLKFDFITSLLDLKSMDDITNELTKTGYSEDISALSSSYKNPELLQMSLNRNFIRKNRVALFSVPPLAKNTVRAYLSKWDIENIKSILASKFMGYDLKQNEMFILSFRDLPMGLFAGNLSNEDFRNLMSKGTVEEVVSYLTYFGFGPSILQHMDRYHKSGDISILLSAFDTYYYDTLMGTVRFYNGDEASVISLIKNQIDVRNIMTVIKGKDMGIEFERFSESFRVIGSLSISDLQSLYDKRDVGEILSGISGYGNLEDAMDIYRRTGDLYYVNVTLQKFLFTRYMEIFRSQALSIGSTFSFILRAEAERENLRIVLNGILNNVEKDTLSRILIPS
ncbi:V-type ATPase subunit [Oxyplasma meridianum]|uniref:V-type ATPase subunit n=1 Tax=Oxyplasma meridianum TaxID=3073602 RepID=A0AAX4NJA8_9ARCH